MKLLFAETDFWKNRLALQETYTRAVRTTFKDVRKRLPQILPTINFVVQASAHESIPEYGTGGFIRNSKLILLFFDPSLPYGEQALLQNTREAVFHELNHAARYAIPIWHHTFLDNCVMEGLATVFERERAGASPLYGQYEAAKARTWLVEIRKKSAAIPWRDYMFTHPDGRKWIGYKVGTYLIDQAVHNSGKTIEELTRMECKDILALADI
jgi:uncharacterized protein YjaZ